MTNIKDEGFSVTLDAPGYYSLAAVLERAFKQASEGKGKERHANSLPFDQQPMQTIAGAHGVGFLTGQAAKKSQEALGLPHERKIAELLGAINYLAGAVLFLESQRPAVNSGAAAIDLEFPLGIAYLTGSGEVGVASKSEAKMYAANSSGIVSPLPTLHNRRKEDYIGPYTAAKHAAMASGNCPVADSEGLCGDCHDVCKAVSRAPANDNWIDWKGGPIPVPHSSTVEVRKRHGDKVFGEKAGAFRWLHADDSIYMHAAGDIVAYRVIHG